MADVPTDADSFRHSDGVGACQAHEVPSGIGCSIRPGVPCPETVLVAVMNDDSYLLVRHPQGEPAAFAVGERLGRRADGIDASIIDGEIVDGITLALPVYAVEPGRKG